MVTLRTTEAIVLVLAIFALVPFMETHPVRAITYQWRLWPIDISGNSGFTSANGVVSGAGTASSPYVVKGWNITRSAGPSIWVHDTDVYFVIEGVYVCSEYGASIALWNVTHGVVQDSQLPQCSSLGGTNIQVANSKDVTISDNNLEDIQAINLSHSSNLTVSGNYVNGTLVPNQGPDAVPTQIYVDHSNNSIFTRNNMFGAILQMTGSEGNLVYRNNFLDRCGTNLGGSFYCSVFGAALDDQSGVNSWDDGYPSGGNYWINYTAADQCSGPSQDVCTGPDGIADRPYHFQNATDKYPQIRAYDDQAPPSWNSLKTFTAWSIGQTSLKLAWGGALDDLGVTSYRIYANGMFLTSVGRDKSGVVETSTSITGLSPGTTYTFYVVAVDVANTTSIDGPSLNVNTAPLWWQITSPVWWQLNWYWGTAVITFIASASFITAFYWRRSKRQKKLTEFA